ncbi:MYB family conidiophore development protein FlbD [Thermoascus aurantiacus ATCC 26904]
MAPTHRRGPWVPEEDEALLRLVREQGPHNWVRISQHMRYRSPKQCRERFHQNLKPTLNRDPITPEEGMMIERMVNEIGKRWAEIARRLGNRSDNAVKNWWNGSMNRKRRSLAQQNGHTSRTSNGRVQPPYPKASMTTSSPADRSRFETISHETPQSFSRRPRPLQLEPIDSNRQLSPVFSLPPSSRVLEAPLTSPAFSDISNAPSLGAPSLVSDHSSVASSSPRTLPSPQLLPLPQGYGEPRRGSAPALQIRDENHFSLPSLRSPEHSKTTESLEMPSMRRWTPDFSAPPYPQLLNSAPSTVPTTPARRESGGSTSADTRRPSRDARMGVDSLLN